MTNPQNTGEIYRLREQRQALRDQHYELMQKRQPTREPAASRWWNDKRDLEWRMNLIDKELDKLTGKKNDWRTDTTPKP